MAKSIEPVIESFLKRIPKKVANTSTNGNELFLFGNCIAKFNDDNVLFVSTSNWNTKTTRDRLNMLPNVFVRSIKNNLQIYNLHGESWQKWDGNFIKINL